MGSATSQNTLEETSLPSSSSKDFPIWDEECDQWIDKRWEQNPEELQLYTELYHTQMNSQVTNPATSFQHMESLRGLIVQGHKGEQG